MYFQDVQDVYFQWCIKGATYKFNLFIILLINITLNLYTILSILFLVNKLLNNIYLLVLQKLLILRKQHLLTQNLVSHDLP